MGPFVGYKRFRFHFKTSPSGAIGTGFKMISSLHCIVFSLGSNSVENILIPFSSISLSFSPMIFVRYHIILGGFESGLKLCDKKLPKTVPIFSLL